MFLINIALFHFLFLVGLFGTSFQIESPGLELIPSATNSYHSPLIWYKYSDKKSIKYYQNEINKALEQYDPSNNIHTNKLENCQPFQAPSRGKFCDVPINNGFWQPCSKESGYNYGAPESGPCIFLKLAAPPNWIPEFYNSTTVHQAAGMSEYLKYQINDAEMRGHGEHKIVWVTCDGEEPADMEHIGPILYIPQRGFPSQYFPYNNQDGYLSPLVAVFFEWPARGVVINIVCKLWAKNINYEGDSIRFSILADY